MASHSLAAQPLTSFARRSTARRGRVARTTRADGSTERRSGLGGAPLTPRSNVVPRRPRAAAGAVSDVAEATPLTTTSTSLADYVESKGGKRVIRKVLVANNGMAAAKAIMSMRRWAYTTLGDEDAIQFLAMATPEDLKANAEFIRQADDFVEVPGGSNKNNYANVDLIVDLAVRERVDAVWPGWGHASENPKLPNTLKEKGIQFIGPTGPVMSVLGDKIAANILAQTAKVPSIPWSGDGLEAKLNDEGTIPDEIFNKAMVTTSEEALAAANRIGYPVMLKASEGGGGKGIRMSANDDELKANFEQVKAEVPGSPMFMMQLCTQARHLEVQIVGDEYGNAIALNGRDCSTQRRFQKIFEEGPPTIAPRDVFRDMEKAAQRLTQSIGYIGAGTVEYLFNAETGKYFFLELNPRLQVEHPVTEGLTGVNLPATQLQVAMGIPLTRIPEIRKFYGRDVRGDDQIDFMEEEYVLPERHVIAARITAENPDEGFKPTSGSIERVAFQSTPSVWGYFSVGANGGIHEFADSQFGHVFASGPTREEARKALVLALKDMVVRGEIRTAVEYLVQLLETDEFKENTIDTSWLDGLIKTKMLNLAEDPSLIVASAAIWRAHQQFKEKEAACSESWKKGQLGLQGLESFNTQPIELTYQDVKYSFSVARSSPDTLVLSLGGSKVEAKVREQSDGTLLAFIEGEAHQIDALEEPLGLRLVLDGNTWLLPFQFDPSELRTDVTGKLIRFLQDDGAVVEAGKPYAEAEAMKMVMPLIASETGTISHEKPPGSVIEAGDLLASLELSDPSRVKKIETYTGDFAIPSEEEAAAATLTPTEELEEAIEGVNMILQGYASEVQPAVQRLLSALCDAGVERSAADDSSSLLETAMDVVASLIDNFLAVEQLYSGRSEDAVVAELIKANKNTPEVITANVVAHCQLEARNALLLSLLRQVPTLPQRVAGFGPIGWADDHAPMLPHFRESLEKLSQLRGTQYGELALEASNVLLEKRLPPIQDRLSELRDILAGKKGISQVWGGDEVFGDLQSVVESPTLAVDLLPSLFTGEDAEVRNNALEVYLKRVYRAYDTLSVKTEDDGGVVSTSWKFKFNTPPLESPEREGMLAVLSNEDEVEAKLPTLLERFESHLGAASGERAPINVLHLALCDQGEDPALAERMQAVMEAAKPKFEELGVKFVNVIAFKKLELPRYFTFTNTLGFAEDSLYRGERPTIAHLLELARLKNYSLDRVPTVNRDLHVYVGTSKEKTVRAQQRHLLLRRISHSKDVAEGGLERILLKALDAVELAMLDPRATSTSSSRIYINVLPEQDGSAEESSDLFSNLLSEFISVNAPRLLQLRVDELEVKVRTRAPNGEVQPIRVMASSMTGQWLKINTYREYLDPVTGAATSFCMIGGEEADRCFLDPYPIPGSLGKRRAAARRVGSTYIYDFLGLFEKAIVADWRMHLDAMDGKSALAIPNHVFSAKELVMRDGKLAAEDTMMAGTNTIGMVAWHCVLKTPQYPQGREMVLVGNDCTFQGGSFGVEEDDFFNLASKYARELGLPRLYIACNAGARIGLVEELKPLFEVAWKDEANPGAGFDYLYLPKEAYDSLEPGAVEVEEVKVGAETRYKLTDIIGNIHGIGVENLRGSGMIAGETSRAYEETFTLSYITGRSVGIGAYLCRLGQRNIQMKTGPMILTGFGALNKLLGRKVYTSQDQLGGPQVMMPNGVSHMQVDDDQEGVSAMLNWLAYVPATVDCAPMQMESADPVDREVQFMPTKTPYDPRSMIAGVDGPEGWTSGFFDKGSFTETLPEWGKTVVTGRARLGGIPVGVIAVETRTMEQRIPADPADPESREAVLAQAGQVWFPDSAHKTAQALNDFNRAENLPVMIFANWRGFSGGTRDMYGEILKFGAMIVDALRDYKHPVFIYIPPNGELRGGSWVVVDPTINEEMMEMYADTEARGGILEPPGICEVKYRAGDQLKTMHRTDPVLKSLDQDAEGNATEIKAREEALSPLYLQVAHEFADLHDRSGRMSAKGVIRKPLTWQSSRAFFYHRLRRRLAEDAARRELVASVPGMDADDASRELQKLLSRKRGAEVAWDNDEGVAEWLVSDAANITKHAQMLKRDATIDELNAQLASLDAAARSEVLSRLQG